MKVKLTLTTGRHRGRAVEFSAHDTLVIGRSKDAQVRLPFGDDALSRFHFLIEANPPWCRIMDMASTNGTYVNGRRVTTVDLNDGDLIKVGRSVLRVAFEPVRRREASSLLISLGRAAFSPADPDSAPATAGAPGGGLPETVTMVSGMPAIPRYRIGRELGRGGMGIVYLAHGELDGAPAAIKTITPRAISSRNVLARFLREASLLRKLDHPHIVGFREVGHTQGLLYFVMEYVPGTNAELLFSGQGDPLSIGRAVDITVQLLEGLAYAHGLGIIHRDVKPSNVIVMRMGVRDVVKVADFGLARLYHNSPMSGLSLAGEFGGTFGFIAPEQITNFREARPATDQYAAGVTLYYLLTGGKIPFDLPVKAEAQLRVILESNPVPIQTRREDIPGPLASVIHRSMSRDPADRFPNVVAFRDALGRFRSGP